MNRRIGRIVVGLAVMVVPGPGADAQEVADSCITCHEVLSGPLGEPAAAFIDDVHAAAGFGCAACHGGDPTIQGPAAMDEAKGYIGRPSHRQVPDLCGRCHSNASFMRQYNPALRVDQVAEYVTSVHGRLLLGAADTAVATCASCHGAHGIRPSSDPRSAVHPLRVADTCEGCHSDPDHMAPYGIPIDQGAEYRRSAHWEAMTEGGDISAPTCNDCHGNHGAAPPGISWVGNVCGQCHVVMADYFQDSRHSATFTAMGVPGCAFCHKNHEVVAASDDMLGVAEGAICRSCHSAESAGGVAAASMRGMIDSLRAGIDSAALVLESAENSGMEVSSSLASLNDAQSALVRARAAIHAFDPEVVSTEAEPGFEVAGEALNRGLDALRDLLFRRIGLIVSVVVIGALILGLVLKIREIEGPTVARGAPHKEHTGGAA